MHNAIRMALLVGAAAAWVSPASATTLAPLTNDQIVDASEVIVRGTVTSVETVDVRGLVRTYAELDVEKVYKGSLNVEHITLESLGGTLDGEIFDVHAAARYSVGEEVVAFVNPHPSRGTWGTVGMFLGKYTVRQNPADGTDMVVRFTIPYSQEYDARFVPAPPAAERVSLSAFEAQIKARVELGWDGKPIPGASYERLRSINRLQAGVR